MLLAVAKVVFQMIALGFKGVVVFVFDLPTRAVRSHQGGHVSTVGNNVWKSQKPRRGERRFWR